MQTISNDLAQLIDDSSQVVTPVVTATFADSKYAYDLRTFSTSEGWEASMERKEPLIWLKCDDSTLVRNSGSTQAPITIGSTLADITGPIGYNDNGAFDVTIGTGFNAPHHDDFNLVGERTIGCWMKIDSAPVAGGTIGKFDIANSSTASEFEYILTFSADSGGSTTVNFVYSDGTNYVSTAIATFTIAGSDWKFFVVTVTERAVIVYANGVFAGVQEIVAPINTTTHPIHFAPGFDGKIDEIFMLDYALKPDEVLSLYRNGTSTDPDEFSAFFSPEQIMNGIKEETLPVMECDINNESNHPLTPNGVYFAMDESIDHTTTEVGWRSRSISDVSGDFATHPIVGAVFEARYANSIDVYTAHTKGRINEVKVSYYDVNDSEVVVGTSTFAAGSDVLSFSLGGDIVITGVRAEVLSTQNPEDYARIHEIDPLYVKDVSADVVDFSITSSRENYEDTLPVGHNNANTFDITLSNVDKKYSASTRSQFHHNLTELPSMRSLFDTATILLRAQKIPWDYQIGDEWVNEGTLGTAYNAIPAYVDPDDPMMDGVLGITDAHFFERPYPGLLIDDHYVVGGTYAPGGTTPSIAGLIIPHHASLDFPAAGALTFMFDITPVNSDDPSYKIAWKYPGTSLPLSTIASYGTDAGGWVLECIDDTGSGADGITSTLFAGFTGTGDPYPAGWEGAIGDENTVGRQTIAVRVDRGDNSITLFRNGVILGTDTITDPGNFTTNAPICIGQDNYYHNIVFWDSALTDDEILAAHNELQYFEPVDNNYIVPDVAFDVALTWDGAADEVAQGKFYVDTWEQSSSAMTTSASCRDFSKVFEEKVDELGIFFTDVSCGFASSVLARSAGVPNRNIRFYDNYYNTIVRDYPIGFWKFGYVADINGDLVDEIVDNQSYDGYFVGNSWSESGDGLHGVIYGANVAPHAESLIPGQPLEYSIGFPGTANQKIQISDNAIFDLSTAWTIECIVSPDVIEDAVVIAKTTNTGVPNNNNFSINMLSTGEFLAQTTNSGNTSGVALATSAAVAEVGGVYHLVATFDGAAQEIAISVNGVTTTSATGFSTCQTNSNGIGVGNVPYVLGSDIGFDGKIQCLSIYDRVLSDDEIEQHYIASQLEEVYQFPYLYSIEQTILESLLEWSTADLGVFFFDQDGVFHYEYRNTIHDENISQHATSQFDLTENSNIVDGSINLELQANKIKVEVNPITTINSDLQSIWRAEDNESLAIAGLRNAVGINDTTIDVNNTQKPAWKKSGYFKIDDEIMSYDGIDGKTFLGVKRGLFDTVQTSHTNGKAWYFTDDTEYWEPNVDNAEATFTEKANCTIKRNASVYRTTAGSLRVRSTVGSTGGTWMGPRSPSGKAGEEVRGSTSYSASAWTKAKTDARTVKLRFIWFDSDGKYISKSTSAGTANNTSTWTEVTHAATSPSNAKYASIRIIFTDIAAGEVHYIDDVVFPGARNKVREVRVYDIKFDQVPAIGVKYPLLIAEEFDKTAEIEEFTHDNFNAHIVVSATKKAPIGDVVLLEGTDPLTDLNYYFAISGIPLVEKSSGESVESSNVENNNYVRRFGLKEMTITNKFIQSKDYAQMIADWLLQHYADPVPVLDLTILGVPHLQNGDRITVHYFDAMNIFDTIDYWLIENSISYSGGIEQNLKLRKVS